MNICRVSDEEDLKTAINLKKKVKWVWFETQFPFKNSYKKLKKLKSQKFKNVLDLHRKKIKFKKRNIIFKK